MPGCARITGSLHVNIQMAVLIEILKDLSSDICWCSCKILSTKDHTVDVITHDEYADLFSCKGDSIKESWYCILNALI